MNSRLSIPLFIDHGRRTKAAWSVGGFASALFSVLSSASMVLHVWTPPLSATTSIAVARSEFGHLRVHSHFWHRNFFNLLDCTSVTVCKRSKAPDVRQF